MIFLTRNRKKLANTWSSVAFFNTRTAHASNTHSTVQNYTRRNEKTKHAHSLTSFAHRARDGFARELDGVHEESKLVVTRASHHERRHGGRLGVRYIVRVRHLSCAEKYPKKGRLSVLSYMGIEEIGRKGQLSLALAERVSSSRDTMYLGGTGCFLCSIHDRQLNDTSRGILLRRGRDGDC